MKATEEQVKYYEQNGYLILDSEIPESVLNAVISDLQDKYTADSKSDVTYQDAGRIQDAWRISENVRNLALNPKILSVLETLYQRQPLAFQTLNFPVGTQQKPHSDTIHFNSKPAGFMCGAWIALEDMDENNGTLIYYPKSHQLPEVTMSDFGCELETRKPFSPSQFFRLGLRKLGIINSLPTLKSADAYQLYEKHIAKVIEENNLKPAYAIIKKGQIFIWAANLLHGGSPLKDKNRTRHSQVTHYFFEDCRYFTPMLSNSENTCWREPMWIS
jgi:ectoine hydroxylase-related dioxygenase (phytanoyl-CoA dioxygenase family)